MNSSKTSTIKTAKSSNKTQKSPLSVSDYLLSVDAKYHQDCQTLVSLMTSITGMPAVMWGASLIGFGEYHYRYDSGREGTWFVTGFSPRKQALTIYIMSGFERYPKLMDGLGKYKIGKSCLYVKSLADIDIEVLTQLIIESIAYLKQTYPEVSP